MDVMSVEDVFAETKTTVSIAFLTERDELNSQLSTK